MFEDKTWKELNEEISKLSREYAELKNKPKPFETEDESEAREDQIKRDRSEKYQEFDSLKTDSNGKKARTRTKTDRPDYYGERTSRASISE
jgi:hypothetical protein